MRTIEVIALTGLSGSGKGEVAEIFQNKYSFQILSVESLIQRRLSQNGNESADKLKRMRSYVEIGEKQLIALTAHEIARETSGSQSKRILIDSVFLRGQHLSVSKMLPYDYDYSLVGVHAPEVTRFRRMNPQVTNVDSSPEFATFMKNDLFELGHGEFAGRGFDVKHLIRSSDIIIDNGPEQTLNDLVDSVTQVYAHMKRNRLRVLN